MKTCSLCKLPKSKGEFNKNQTKPDGLQTKCRDCSRKHSKGYYAANSNKMKTQVAEAGERRIEENSAKLVGYLLAHPCKCGEKDPVVLDFDHVVGKKIANVSHMVSNGSGWNRIEKEIRKCQVLCANCHRRKTAREQRHTRFGLVMSMASIAVSYTVREGSTPSEPTEGQ